MPVENFFRFNGVCYSVGTKLRFYKSYNTYIPPIDGVIESFVGARMNIRGNDGRLYQFSTNLPLPYHINPIVEIIQPVYYEEKTENYVVDNRVLPPIGDVDIGWVWYIIIMLVATIFKDRFIIWIVATAVFFLWKNGFLNGGKK